MGITEIVTIFAVVATNLGTVIALYIQSDKKIDEHRKETNAIVESIRVEVRAIHQEIKDFHGKLERQDAEFKGKMALQDAEFKSHLLQFHKDK